MNPLFAQLALDWLEAERLANPDAWPVSGRPTKDEMTVAIDRVYQVISGEVKWSETSPGDKAVWKSRVQDIPMFLRSWRKDGKNKDPDEDKDEDDIDLYNQTTPRPPPRPPAPRRGGVRVIGNRWQFYWNYFDTYQLIGPQSLRSWTLFNETNIGNRFLCNLEVPGQIPGGDATFSVTTLSVAVSSLEALHWAANRVTVQFVIGTRPAAPTLFVRDLFRGVPLARPAVIPVRQNFGAQVSLRETPPADLAPWDLVFHVEGIQGRAVQ